MPVSLTFVTSKKEEISETPEQFLVRSAQYLNSKGA